MNTVGFISKLLIAVLILYSLSRMKWRMHSLRWGSIMTRCSYGALTSHHRTHSFRKGRKGRPSRLCRLRCSGYPSMIMFWEHCKVLRSSYKHHRARVIVLTYLNCHSFSHDVQGYVARASGVARPLLVTNYVAIETKILDIVVANFQFVHFLKQSIITFSQIIRSDGLASDIGHCFCSFLDRTSDDMLYQTMSCCCCRCYCCWEQFFTVRTVD